MTSRIVAEGMPRVVSVPASSTRENEDAALVGDGVAVVVDGAGLPAELRSGCRHSVAWFARSVATTLHERLAARSGSMREALAETIVDVADSHRGTCRLVDGSPSATVAAWRTSETELEYLVLCDASVILVGADGAVTEVTDQRLAEVVDAATRALAPGSPDDRRAALTTAVEESRNTDGGFWCVHHDPQAAARATEGRVALGALCGVLACSDGATRAFQVLGTHTLADFATEALRGDTSALVATIRRAETARAETSGGGAGKVHDDLTFVAQRMAPDEESHA